MPLHMVKPSQLELMKRGRRDFAEIERYTADPKAFLVFLDQLGVERAGLINYVSPDIMGFTPNVNDWIARYCRVAPDRLLAFGSVHPRTVADPGAEVDRIAKLEYFPRIADIADKVLWGTDWPGPGVPEMRGNVEKFNALPLSEEIKRKILYDNAARLFPR